MIAFAGTSDYGARCLDALLAAGVEIGVVLTQPDRPAGRRRLLTPPPVAVRAQELGLPLLQPERPGDVRDELRRGDVAAVAICAYGQLVRPPLLDDVPWLNLHPSPLPRWRGAAPVERALLAGDTASAACVMRIVEALDEGPLASAEPFPIGPDDDAGALMERSLDLGVPRLAAALRAAVRGDLVLEPQRADGATYAAKLTRDDRLLDPARGRVEERNRVRALSPHIGAVLDLGGAPVTVWRAALAADPVAPGAVAVDGGRLVVGFADGALELERVQPAGKRPLPAADFLRGVRHALGPARRLA